MLLQAAVLSILCLTMSCTDSSKETDYSSHSTDPCTALQQECLSLFSQHSSEIARIIKAQGQHTDPYVGDVLSSLYMVSSIQVKEDQIRQTCPEAFQTYERERDNLIALLIAKEVAKELLK